MMKLLFPLALAVAIISTTPDRHVTVLPDPATSASEFEVSSIATPLQIPETMTAQAERSWPYTLLTVTGILLTSVALAMRRRGG